MEKLIIGGVYKWGKSPTLYTVEDVTKDGLRLKVSWKRGNGEVRSIWYSTNSLLTNCHLVRGPEMENV